MDTTQFAYKADGLNWSHPIIQGASNPSSLFDSISYDKVYNNLYVYMSTCTQYSMNHL